MRTSTTTPRQAHWSRLTLINELTEQLGRIEPYIRSMSFAQTAQWERAYYDMRLEGYPLDEAYQRAWDLHFSSFKRVVS